MTHLFGLGDGWLPRKAAVIARNHGADLVNHTDPQCSCGRGCDIGECKASRRHWFEAPDLGEPFNFSTAAEVEAALKRAGI